MPGIPRAGRVSPADRRRALLQASDVADVVRIGSGAAERAAGKAVSAAVNGYVRGDDPAAVFMREIEARLLPVLVGGMVYARLRGVDRVRSSAESIRLAGRGDTPYDRAVEFLRSAMRITNRQIKLYATQAVAPARTILAELVGATTARIRRSIATAVAQGATTDTGKRLLREAFNLSGVTPANKFTIEAVFRTHSQLAYAAGRADVLAAPEVQEILWGFRYVTVGDDRVRPAHIAMDGVTLPKNDPFWVKNTPPNGWACRCTLIEIYDKPAKIERPPTTIQVNDRTVAVGADPGFDFHPANVFRIVRTEVGPGRLTG